MIKNKGLGRGLGAVLGDMNVAPASPAATTMEEVEISMINPNPKQPRRDFDPEAMEELAASIRTLGIIQPITVKKVNDMQYVIISGERRFRAAQMAGLTSVPVYVREADDQKLHEMALVENIQREDLNAMEVALSLQRLIDECSLTQDMLSERVGKRRSTIANYMRLLRMPAEIQLAIREGVISMGHAKAIASAPEQHQTALLRKCVKKGLSVRQTEEEARRLCEARPAAPRPADEEYPESYGRLLERMEGLFSQEISIRRGRNGGGKIVIDFSSDDEIEQFIAHIDSLKH